MSVTIPFLGRFLELEANLVQRFKASDYHDRLYNIGTPWLLAFCAIMIGTKMNLGTPISCLFPVEIDEHPSWCDYFHQYCFVTNTYQYNTIISANGEYVLNYQRDSTVNYYQWVPFLLSAQILAFCLPAVFWRVCFGKATLKFESVIRAAKDYQALFGADKEAAWTLTSIADHLINSQNYERARGEDRRFRGLLTRRLATTGYIAYKILCIVNVVIQLYITAHFLGIRSWEIGFAQIKASFETNLHNSSGFGVFPRTVMCHSEKTTSFGQQVTDQPIQYDFQCLLFVNYINEKVFLFLWLWYLILYLISVLNLFSWIYLIGFPNSSFSVQGIYDQANRDISGGKWNSYETFFTGLGADGRLLFAFIKIHTGDLTVVEIIDEILNRLGKKQEGILSAPITPKNSLFTIESAPIEPKKPSKAESARLQSAARARGRPNKIEAIFPGKDKKNL